MILKSINMGLSIPIKKNIGIDSSLKTIVNIYPSGHIVFFDEIHGYIHKYTRYMHISKLNLSEI